MYPQGKRQGKGQTVSQTSRWLPVGNSLPLLLFSVESISYTVLISCHCNSFSAQLQENDYTLYFVASFLSSDTVVFPLRKESPVPIFFILMRESGQWKLQDTVSGITGKTVDTVLPSKEETEASLPQERPLVVLTQTDSTERTLLSFSRNEQITSCFSLLLLSERESRASITSIVSFSHREHEVLGIFLPFILSASASSSSFLYTLHCRRRRKKRRENSSLIISIISVYVSLSLFSFPLITCLHFASCRELIEFIRAVTFFDLTDEKRREFLQFFLLLLLDLPSSSFSIRLLFL